MVCILNFKVKLFFLKRLFFFYVDLFRDVKGVLCLILKVECLADDDGVYFYGIYGVLFIFVVVIVFVVMVMLLL